MENSNFDQKLEILHQQVNQLKRFASQDAAQSEELPLEALKELLNALEELGAAEEELRQQNEELTTTYQTLESERKRYQDLFEFAPDGYLVTNAAGTIQEANRAVASLLHMHREFLLGTPLSIFMAKEDRKTLLTQLNRLAHTQLERVQDWEVCLQSHKGIPFPSVITVAAVRDPQGKLIGLRWLIRDITEHKRMEEALRRVYNGLEIRVQERTAELLKANEALQSEIIERRWAEEALKENLAQLSKKNRYETIISTVTRSVHLSIDLQDVLENAVEAMSKNIDRVDNVGIFLVEGEEAVMKANRGYPDWFIRRVGRIPYPKDYTWKTIVEGKPRYCVDTDEDTIVGRVGREIGTKSYVSMPIRFEGKTVGAINISSLQKNAFDEEELNLLEIVAQQIEIAINNAQQAEELRKVKDELEMRVEERTTELAKANEELKKGIAERKRAEEQLKASLKEKEVLLKEIHHRVKNNLQVISSLLDLQSQYIRHKKALNMFNESQNRVKSMALIHEILYQSKDLSRINFAEYIQNLGDYLFQSYGANSNDTKLKIDVHGVLLGVNTAIICGLIINELVSNSLKHAFPKGRKGEIRINLRSDNGKKFTLIVSDNGVGFPKDLDFRNTESLGLQLVMALINQLGGTIKLNRNRGTEFKIKFTELKYKERNLRQWQMHES